MGELREGDEVVPIYLRLPENERGGIDHLRDLSVWSDGAQTYVPMANLVERFEPRLVEALIHRRDRERTLMVYGGARNDLTADEAFRSIRAEIEAIPLPNGYKMEWGGEYESAQMAQESLGKQLPIGFLVMLTISILMFNKVRQPLILWLAGRSGLQSGDGWVGQSSAPGGSGGGHDDLWDDPAFAGCLLCLDGGDDHGRACLCVGADACGGAGALRALLPHPSAIGLHWSGRMWVAGTGGLGADLPGRTAYEPAVSPSLTRTKHLGRRSHPAAAIGQKGRRRRGDDPLTARMGGRLRGREVGGPAYSRTLPRLLPGPQACSFNVSDRCGTFRITRGLTVSSNLLHTDGRSLM